MTDNNKRHVACYALQPMGTPPCQNVVMTPAQTAWVLNGSPMLDRDAQRATGPCAFTGATVTGWAISTLSANFADADNLNTVRQFGRFAWLRAGWPQEWTRLCELFPRIRYMA